MDPGYPLRGFRDDRRVLPPERLLAFARGLDARDADVAQHVVVERGQRMALARALDPGANSADGGRDRVDTPGALRATPNTSRGR